MSGQGAVGNEIEDEEDEEEEAEGVESDSDWLERVKKKQLVGIVNNTTRDITFWRERMMTRREKVLKRKTPMSMRIFASGLASKLQNSQELGSPSKSWRRPAKCKVDNKTCGIVQIEIAFSVGLKSLTSWEIRNFLI